MTNQEFKETRQRLGFTQAEFAAHLGIDRVSVARYEKDRAIPKTIELLVAAKFTKIVAYIESAFAAGKCRAETELLGCGQAPDFDEWHKANFPFHLKHLSQ